MGKRRLLASMAVFDRALKALGDSSACHYQNN